MSYILVEKENEANSNTNRIEHKQKNVYGSKIRYQDFLKI